MLPGALFLIFGMLVYAVSSMALAQLGVVWVLHFLVGWIYLFISPFFLPRHARAKKGKSNPFAPAREQKKGGRGGGRNRVRRGRGADGLSLFSKP